jgi:tetratricopeptide (TPR) repeat protein
MLGIFERSEFPLSDEELADRRYKRRRLAIIAGGIIIVLFTGYLLARPTLNAVRGWQARRHAQRAFELIDQEKWADARTEAVAAYQLRATEPAAIRAVARLLSRAGQADALGFWKELKSRDRLTTTDLRDEAAIAVKAREVDIAEGAIQELLKQPDAKPSDLLLAAQLAMQKQDLEGALVRVRKVFAYPDVTDRDRLQATLLLAAILRGKEAKDHTEVFDHLVQLARGSNEVALEALVALAQTYLSSKSPWSNPGGMTVEQIIQGLETHPLAKPQHKLLAVDMKIHLHPEQSDELIKGAIAQFKTGDTNSLVALAGWLNSHGEFQRELDTISRDRAIQNRDLFFQHVDALGALGRWDEIRKLIESEQFPLDPVIEYMYLARCFAQQGQTAGAENNWKRALQSAAGDASKLVTLGEYAEKNNALDVAAAAFDAAVAASPKLRVAQQGRLRAAYAMRDTKKIKLILGELLKIWPNDTAIQNDEAYARLLLLPNPATSEPASPDKAPRPPQEDHRTATELAAIERVAEKLIQREPASLPHRTLLALTRLKQNRPYAALAVYRDINVPKSALTTSTVSVHAAILAATNEKEAAQKEATALPADKLLPEEQALIAPLLSGQ